MNPSRPTRRKRGQLGVRWQAGDERVQRAVDAWVRTPSEPPCHRLHASAYRTLFRLPMPGEIAIHKSGDAAPRSVMIKVHHTRTGPHAQREDLKRRLGWSPALREWQALVELHAEGLPVPEPLAWGRLPSRDPIVVTEYCPGRNLGAVLETASVPARADWIDRLADCIVAFHRSGYRHGDLHLGNLHAQGDRILVMDLQRAQRARRRNERLRDLAQIDLSLARAGLGLALRERLRRRLEDLRGLDRTAQAFVFDFVRGRTRKAKRSGGAWRPFQIDGLVGRHDGDIDPGNLRTLYDEAREDPKPEARRGGQTQMSDLATLMPADVRSGWPAAARPIDPAQVIVKRMRVSSPAKAIQERALGSAARRAYRMGQQLCLLGSLSARPLAYLEDPRGFGPYSNWLFLEKVGTVDLDRFQPESEARAHQCAAELMRWIAGWQAWGIEHLDLKGSNIRIDASGPAFRFWLIDLEDVRFRRRPLPDRARFRALTQLGASLSDEAFSSAARRHGLETYLGRLPFARSSQDSWRAALVRETKARNHRWRGLDCNPGSH